MFRSRCVVITNLYLHYLEVKIPCQYVVSVMIMRSMQFFLYHRALFVLQTSWIVRGSLYELRYIRVA